MRELLSILADIATIVTAVCATGILVKVNISIKNSADKKASQVAKGNDNSQNIIQ